MRARQRQAGGPVRELIRGWWGLQVRSKRVRDGGQEYRPQHSGTRAPALFPLCTACDSASQATCDEFVMFLKQGIIKYHTKPDEADVKALRQAQRLSEQAAARLKMTVLPESQ